MLSAGERPQPPQVDKARIMPDLSNGTATSVLQENPTNPAHVQHIWVVTGPAGCGKSTVGNVLRTELGVPFLEGDDVRPPSLPPTKPPKSPSNRALSTTQPPIRRKWAKEPPSQTQTAGTG